MTRGGRRQGAGRPPAGEAKRVRVSLTLPPELIAAADREAAARGLSRSEMLTRALAERYGGADAQDPL